MGNAENGQICDAPKTMVWPSLSGPNLDSGISPCPTLAHAVIGLDRAERSRQRNPEIMPQNAANALQCQPPFVHEKTYPAGNLGGRLKTGQ
jgi:hypothetical protein